MVWIKNIIFVLKICNMVFLFNCAFYTKQFLIRNKVFFGKKAFAAYGSIFIGYQTYLSMQPYKIELHLIRHGQTEYNKKGIY